MRPPPACQRTVLDRIPLGLERECRYARLVGPSRALTGWLRADRPGVCGCVLKVTQPSPRHLRAVGAQGDAAADSFTRLRAAPEQSGGDSQQDWLQRPVNPPVDSVEAAFAAKRVPPDVRDVRRLPGEGAVPHHAKGEQLSPASPE